jgi:hypothetical protein
MRFRVPSKYMVVMKRGSTVYDVIVAATSDLISGKTDVVAGGFATVEEAMRWIWDADKERSQGVADRMADGGELDNKLSVFKRP